MKHKPHYLSNLTPLRGIAALLVAIFHFEQTIAVFIQPQQSMIIEKSYLMVDLFFIMSGFIMVHVYCDSFNKQLTRQSFRRFIVARFARIYPLHLFTLSLMVAIVAFLLRNGMPPNPVTDFAAIPTHLLLLHSFGIHKIFTWNIPSWSISAEWWSYMVFPVLILFISKQKKGALLILSFFVIAAYVSIMYIFPRTSPFDPAVPMPHDLNTTYDYGFLRGLAGFISGMLLYQLYQLQRIKQFFSKDITAIASIAALILCLHIGINDALYVILFAGIVLSFSCNGSYLHKACNIRLGQYLGKISYSIYMMQLFLLLPFAMSGKLPGETAGANGLNNIPFQNGLLFCTLYLLLLTGVSSLSYYTIEQPLRKWINRKWGKEKLSASFDVQPLNVQSLQVDS